VHTSVLLSGPVDTLLCLVLCRWNVACRGFGDGNIQASRWRASVWMLEY